MNIEVFKTDVTTIVTANIIVSEIIKILPHAVVNFDLEDCDHILRVEANDICKDTIVKLLQKLDVEFEILE
jgi:hypothetical protein